MGDPRRKTSGLKSVARKAAAAKKAKGRSGAYMGNKGGALRGRARADQVRARAGAGAREFHNGDRSRGMASVEASRYTPPAKRQPALKKPSRRTRTGY